MYNTKKAGHPISPKNGHITSDIREAAFSERQNGQICGHIGGGGSFVVVRDH